MNDNFFDFKNKKEGDANEKKEDDCDELENLDSIGLTRPEWFPDQLVYELNISRRQLKKTEGLKRLHKWIQKAGDCGILTRQELVSMLPPIALEPKQDDVIFDMCAAPGSKTSQQLETIYHDFNKNNDKNLSDIYINGAVVSNDMDYKRAWMLTHQLKRINTSAMLIANHPGQFFPHITRTDTTEDTYDKKYYFDKVLADVPCSGDGAIRKLPNRWKWWKTADGHMLHDLQVTLLKKAIQMTKVGGYTCYSTCSLNPIENEAVITEILRQVKNNCEGALELVDVHPIYKGFKGRQGLHKWSVLLEKKGLGNAKEQYTENPDKEYKAEELFTIYDEITQETVKKLHGRVKKGMLPDDEETMKNVYKTHYSMRVMPHDQNTGGFFVALFKKNSNVQFTGPNTNEHKNEEAEPEMIEEVLDLDQEEEMVEEKDANQVFHGEGVTKDLKNNYISFTKSHPEDWEMLTKYYGFENFPEDHLFIHENGERTVSIVNNAVKNILNFDREKKEINQVNLGIKAFEKSKTKDHYDETKYRLTQTATEMLWPFMTKRKFEITQEELLFQANFKNAKLDDVDKKYINLRKVIDEVQYGFFVVRCEISKGVYEFMAGQRMKHSLVVLADKDHVEGMKIKYEQSFYIANLK